MKKILKKGIVSVVAAVVMMAPNTFSETYSMFPLNDVSIVQTMDVEAAYVPVQRGCFNGNNWNSGTVVCVTNNRKSAKIKICAFMQNGRIKSGKYYVDVYGCDHNGNSLQKVNKSPYQKSGSSYISLNSGYSYYRVYIKRRGTDGTNVSRTQY